jgi:hypothetical protein
MRAVDLAAAQLALQASPEDEGVVGTLRAAAGRVASALRAAVEDRLSTDGFARAAREVVEAGQADFLGVYEAVWKRIEGSDVGGGTRLKEAVAALALVLPAAGDGDGLWQPATADAVQLLQQAARVKPKFDALLCKLLPGVHLDLPKVRAAPFIAHWFAKSHFCWPGATGA